MPIEHVLDAVPEWQARQQAAKVFADYYDGVHQLKFVTPDWMSKYAAQILDNVSGRVMSIRQNLCPVVVTAFTDPISVTSWGADDIADEAARQHLDATLAYMAAEAWLQGDAYAIVSKDATGRDRAYPQKAADMVPVVDQTNPGALEYAVKLWFDRDGYGRAACYYADRVERWATARSLGKPGEITAGQMPRKADDWTEYDGDGVAPVIRHDYGAVPVVWVKTDADSPAGHGRSVLADVIPLQDGLNASLANLLVNQEAYARPFWYLLNFKPAEPLNPYLPGVQDGMASDPAATVQRWPQPPQGQRRFDPTRQQIVTHDGPGPFGQLDPPDLTRLLKVQDAFAAKICAVSGIPPYLLQGDIGQVPSGAALRQLEARRTARVRRWETANQGALVGLKQLLGLGDDPIEWAPIEHLDALERWEIAQIRHSLGYALADAIDGTGETDIDGITQRAAEAATNSAAAMGQAFLSGTGAAQY